MTQQFNLGDQRSAGDCRRQPRAAGRRGAARMRPRADRVRQHGARRRRRRRRPRRVSGAGRAGITRHRAARAHAGAACRSARCEALIARLKDLPGPKTIVLLSEGMIVDPRRVDLSQLAAAGAGRARHDLRPAARDADVRCVAGRASSPTAHARSARCVRTASSQVAGAARGAVFRQVGTDPKPFERICRELSGYYLLAFEARDGDRDGRPHRIRVSLARGGGEMRARTGFTLPAPTPPARGAELTALLRSLAPVTELPLRVATYTYAEPGAARAARRDQRGSRQPRHAVGHVAGVRADRCGRRDCGHRHAPGAATGAIHSAPSCPQARYTLRAAAIDPFGRQGSVERVLPRAAGGRRRTAPRRLDAGRTAGVAERSAGAVRRSRHRQRRGGLPGDARQRAGAAARGRSCAYCRERCG